MIVIGTYRKGSTMEALVIERGNTFKRVVVRDIPAGTTEQDIIDAALKAAGETRSSLFGIRVREHPQPGPRRVVVTLHTD